MKWSRRGTAVVILMFAPSHALGMVVHEKIFASQGWTSVSEVATVGSEQTNADIITSKAWKRSRVLSRFGPATAGALTARNGSPRSGCRSFDVTRLSRCIDDDGDYPDAGITGQARLSTAAAIMRTTL